MLKFLARARQCQKPSLYVIGNESADMDSCCSALVGAYLWESSHPDEQVVPLIQVPRQNLGLRKDIVSLFDKLEIDRDWLRFADEEHLSAASHLFLVDHNSSTVPGKVVKVIDHHEPEGYIPCDDIVLQKTGSCISLVVEALALQNRSLSNLFENDSTLVQLCLAPILMDTGNLTNDKTTVLDRNVVNALGGARQMLALSVDTMKSLKKDLSGISAQGVLLKDYKEWGRLGISSLPKLLPKIWTLYPHFAQALEQFREDRGLLVVVAMASGNDKKSGRFVRQMAVSGNIDGVSSLVDAVPDLQLELVNEIDGVKVYDQHNTASSRKQVAPLLRGLSPRFA